MKLRNINKKGNAFNILKVGALGLGIAFIVVAVLALITDDLSTALGGNFADGSDEQNATQSAIQNGTEGLSNLSSFGGIFGTILAVVILLSLVALIKFKNR